MSINRQVLRVYHTRLKDGKQEQAGAAYYKVWCPAEEGFVSDLTCKKCDRLVIHLGTHIKCRYDENHTPNR